MPVKKASAYPQRALAASRRTRTAPGAVILDGHILGAHAVQEIEDLMKLRRPVAAPPRLTIQRRAGDLSTTGRWTRLFRSADAEPFVPFVGEPFPSQTSPQIEELFRALRKGSHADPPMSLLAVSLAIAPSQAFFARGCVAALSLPRLSWRVWTASCRQRSYGVGSTQSVATSHNLQYGGVGHLSGTIKRRGRIRCGSSSRDQIFRMS
jgi:hypothetical protein